MMLTYILLAITIILLIIILIKLFTQKSNDHKLDALSTEIKRIEESVRKEIFLNRTETSNQSVRARSELANSLESFEKKLQHLTETIDHKLTSFSESNNNNALASRTEIKQTFELFKKDLAQSIQDFNAIQKENFSRCSTNKANKTPAPSIILKA
jgi:DNA recombination protein RmuC